MIDDRWPEHDNAREKRRQIEDLAQQLARTEAALDSLTAGQVDAVLDPVAGVPILLRQAQAELRRARDELEERVRQRTAELERANQALRIEMAGRERAQVALQQYASRLQIFHDMDRAILAAQSAKEIATVALRHLWRLLAPAAASVIRFDYAAGQVSLLATDGKVGAGLRAEWPRSLDGGWLVDDLREGRAYVVDDVLALAEPDPLTELLLNGQVRSGLHVPLMANGQLIGVLSLGMAMPGQLAPDQVAVAREVATQLAVGVQQASLHAQVEHYASVLEQQVAERTAGLQASEARMRAILEGAGIGIAIVDRNGRLGETNEALQEMLGFDGQELRGRPFDSFLDPDQARPRFQFYREMMAGRRGPRRHQEEVRYRGCEGEWRWANATVSVVGRTTGAPQFAIVLLEDTTEQKRIREALLRSEKLAVAGRLTAQLAHEINNPLQAVIGCVGLAQEALAEGRGAGNYLDVAMDEMLRVAHLVHQLRDMHIQPSQEAKKPVDVAELLRQVVALTGGQGDEREAGIGLETDKDLPLLLVDPVRIRELFLNVVLNAVDAVPQGGQIQIAARRTAEPAGVRITCTDDGPGIAPEDLPHVFEPFFSTKPRGMGLGLYVSHQTAEEHGGHIDIDSRLGAGTTVAVWLPASASPSP